MIAWGTSLEHKVCKDPNKVGKGFNTRIVCVKDKQCINEHRHSSVLIGDPLPNHYFENDLETLTLRISSNGLQLVTEHIQLHHHYHTAMPLL